MKIGNEDAKLYLGGSEVEKIYLGTEQVFDGSPSFSGKWLATYVGGTTSSAECDSSSAISQNEITLTNLTNVVIGDCVTGIGESAFTNCSSLTSVTIPDSVTSIGNSAFLGCSGLTDVTIGSGVTSIGSFAFFICQNLTSITIYATTPPTLLFGAFDNTNNCPIYVPAESLTAYQTNWSTYASRIQAIPSPSFSGKWLATYDGGTTASAECDSTSAITENEIALTNLTDVVIGDCVTSIGTYAFILGSSLTSVTIPDSVTTIGYEAFGYCDGLTSVTIPDSVTSIGYGAFVNCTGLTSVTVEATTPPTLDMSVFSDTNDCPIYVPAESVNTFKSASGWDEYASRIRAIPQPFYGKWVATDIYETTSSAECDSTSAITEGEIVNVTDITDVVIGDCVTTIGDRVFQDCIDLTSVTIGNNVTTIGDAAFVDCRGLTSVAIPNSVTSIGTSAFTNCISLTSLTIGNSVTSIGSYAFGDCSSLTSVTIGSGVTDIGELAFVGCRSVETLTLLATTPPTLGLGVFSDTNDCPIYVPSASLTAYQSASGWSDYSSRIQAIS